MRHARWKLGGIELVDEPAPALPAGWARLQVTSCGICGSDLHLRHAVDQVEPATMGWSTPGHEIAGVVADAPGGSGLDAGAVYVVEPWQSCGSCDPCGNGERQLCGQGRLIGVELPGGMAETVDVPVGLLHRVDGGFSPVEASLAEPWAVAARAVHLARPELDSRVLVLGGGTIGLMAALAARDRAGEVAVSCRYPHQAAAARYCGLVGLEPADVAAWVAERQPDVVVETVGGEADTMAEAVTWARPGGRIVVVGVFTSPRPADFTAVMMKEIEVVGSFLYGRIRRGSGFRAAVGAMGRFHDELTSLQTHRFGLASVADALAAAGDKRSGAVKVTVIP